MANPFESMTDEQLGAALNKQQSDGLQFTGTTGRSARNNNPLNLEYRPGSYQDKFGAMLEPSGGGKDKRPRFAAFPTMMDGYLAGLEQIKIDQSRGHTLGSFVNKFAPPHENPTGDLIAQYGQFTGAGPDTPLAQIPAEQLIIPMLARESSTKIVGAGAPALGPKPQQKNVFESMSDEDLFSALNKQAMPTQAPPTPPEMPQEGIVFNASNMMPQEQPIAQPESLESKVLSYVPQGLQDALKSGLSKISGAAQYLTPTISQTGAIAGGMAGAKMGAMTGNPLGALGGGLVGAGLGYAGTRQAEKVADVVSGKQMPPISEQIPEVGKDFATGVGIQATGDIGGAALTKMFAPIKSAYDRLKLSSQLAVEIENMVKSGMPVSPDIQAPNWATKTYQWWVEKLPFGKKITDSYRWDTVKGINAMRDNFLNKAGYPMARTEEEILKMTELRKGLYGKALEEGGTGQIPIPNVQEVIRNLPKEALATSYYQKVLKPKLLKEGGLAESMTWADINDAFIPTKMWGSKFDPKRMPINQMKWREDLLTAMKADVGAYDAAQSTKILQNYEAGHKMGEVIRGSNKSNFLQDLLDKSTRNFELQEMFNPGEFSRLLNSGESKKFFLRNFNKSERDMITSFAKKMELVGQDLARLEKPSPGLGTFLPMAGATYYRPEVAVPLGFPLFTAWSLMKPDGLTRRWLTSGLMPGRTIAGGTLATKIKMAPIIEKGMGQEND